MTPLQLERQARIDQLSGDHQAAVARIRRQQAHYEAAQAAISAATMQITDIMTAPLRAFTAELQGIAVIENINAIARLQHLERERKWYRRLWRWMRGKGGGT